MIAILPYIITLTIYLLIILDLVKKINLMHPLPLTPFLLVSLNPILSMRWMQELTSGFSVFVKFMLFSVIGIWLFHMWMRLIIFPVWGGRRAGVRVKIMIGGRKIIHTALYAMFLQGFMLYFVYGTMNQPLAVLVRNIVYGTIVLLALFFYGGIRIFFTSKRLSLLRRVVMLLTMWIPLVNLFVLLYICRLVYEEYDFACEKEALRMLRVDSDICKTKYPLVMVHGVLFRDLKYFNYWGRIPKELMRYGATIYYGNQEAVGTIVYNAEDLKKKILEVVAETGCEKVNIIAHSKGGLDSRYAISMLGMDEYVASLTTMNTPHRGCRFVDKACLLPDGLYRFIAKLFDNSFRKFGDKNPDFYTATRQFSTKTSEAFNAEVKDSDKVYYQSYMTKMKTMFSDALLSIPYLMIKPLEGANDGLVSVPSAMWGDYRGLICSTKRRGISHGDIIDLKREDYKGFDVVETYVNIVVDLKEKGF